jgi:hypothetical protein
MKDAFLPKRYTAQDFFSSPEAYANASTAALQEEAAKKALAYNAAAGMGPGIGGAIRSYGPAIAAGTALLGATGGFKAPEEEEAELPFGGVTGQDLLEMDPEQIPYWSA